MVGWTSVYTGSTAVTSDTYLSPFFLTQGVISNCVQYSSTGSVQYVSWVSSSASTSFTPSPWQIIPSSPTWPTVWHAVAPWRPATPAVIRGALRRAQERHVPEMEQRTRQHDQRRQAASARARALLIGELDPVQRAEFLETGSFVVIGPRGRYRINNGINANIEVERDGRVRERLCVHPEGAYGMPVEDTMLAQLLHLRANESELLRIANRYPAIAA